MGLRTIPFREIENQAENMYEAVAAMSGQARVELQERIVSRTILEHQEEELDVYDDYEEKKPEEYEEMEKVTTVAVDKFLDGDVKWKKIQLEP
jgi:hypothetical protein